MNDIERYNFWNLELDIEIQKEKDIKAHKELIKSMSETSMKAIGKFLEKEKTSENLF